MKKRPEDMEVLKELRDSCEYELICLEEIELLLNENITVESASYDEVKDLFRVLRNHFQVELDELKTLLENKKNE